MRHLYRGGVLVACLVVCFAIAGGAAAAPSIPVSVAASVDSFTSDIGCCVESTLGDPYTVVVPRLGRLTAVADLDVCGDSCEPDGISMTGMPSRIGYASPPTSATSQSPS